MSDKLKDIGTFALVVLASIGGFFVGKKQTVPVPTLLEEKNIKETVAVVELTELNADSLVLNMSEGVRIIWSEGKNKLEESGEQKIPLGQVDTVNSKKLSDFLYVGNAKTRKFYPSRSYPARGTEIRYRRFFDSKKSAQAAGFIASKLVK